MTSRTLTPEERAEGFARQEEAFAMADLVERFREGQAKSAKQAQARDSALAAFCVRADLSLVMMKAIVDLLGRKAISPELRRATSLLMSELDHLDTSLTEVLETCVETYGGGEV